ncbi:MAG: hypothetical protein ABR543_07535 [Gemmatimonadaceae bacterium]
MINTSRRIISLLAVALAPLGASDPAETDPTSTNSCTLEYQRADNMWAGHGRPDGNLGVETITIQAGQTKVFITDWKYEKMRNDGTNYYGSHLRIATNRGQSPVRVPIRDGVGGTLVNWFTVPPGVQTPAKADLMEVNCPVL